MTGRPYRFRTDDGGRMNWKDLLAYIAITVCGLIILFTILLAGG